MSATEVNSRDVPCTVESAAVAVPSSLDGHVNYWKAPAQEDLLINLPDACVDELDRWVNTGKPESRENLNACLELANHIRFSLDTSPGLVLLDRVPVERYSSDESVSISGMFASLIAPLMGQDVRDTKLYSVVDAGHADTSTVRKSKTNEAQPYHTDGGWFQPPAQYIGLFCVQAAEQGGISRATSLALAYETIRQLGDSDILNALRSDMPWNRQKEHLPDEDGWLMNPSFIVDDSVFIGRFYKSYVTSGSTLAGVALSDVQIAALETLDQCISAQKTLEFMLQPGQFQLVNNWTVVHARGAFEDDTTSKKVRHLVRVWMTHDNT